ncbi:antitoxin ParD1/3/4 [Rhizobium tibeticum]|uniref:ribbon-helix-helix domain-containing protein n=1 Tax=Rhizobium tibeticum TaxID=501024 RepID=UPI002786159A|nr:type II toxin-antitoxin system ParD family antitoxin [Rhizobium tibeticum]MDP9809882.1 antitoxin ParD1/3/4 [Rhizobium tibeticum]
MNVKSLKWLSEKQHAFVRSLVSSGRYFSLNSVLRAGLDLLRTKIEEESVAIDPLRATIERRLRGPAISAEEMQRRVEAVIERKRRET